jgi:hypothetical protein
MNESSNNTGGRAGNRQARHLHRSHRLNDGSGERQDRRCRERRGQTFGHRAGLEGTGRPGGFTSRGHHDHAARGGNRRPAYELHQALAEVARTGDQQIRDQAAHIVTEATTRLNSLLTTDR